MGGDNLKFNELAWGAFVFRYFAGGDPTYSNMVSHKDYLIKLQNDPKLQDLQKIRDFIAHYGIPYAPKSLADQIYNVLPTMMPHVCMLKTATLQGCNLKNISEETAITEAYRTLNYNCWGGDTVVSKILHFFNTSLLMMWDDDIRLKYCGFAWGSLAYLDFLKKMQEEIEEANKDYKKYHKKAPIEEFLSTQLGYNYVRPLTKYIDDYNWITITKGWPTSPPDWIMTIFKGKSLQDIFKSRL